MSTPSHVKIRKLTQLSMLAALIVVLQILSALLSRTALLPFNLTLTLVPLVIGAMLYGVSGGCILGAAFGAIVVINVLVGLDPSGIPLWSASPLLMVLLCLAKGVAAGACAGLMGRLFRKKNLTLATFCAAAIAPVVNTGLFLLGMFTCFYDMLVEWANGSSVIFFAITGIAGINFLIEFGLNLILAPASAAIVRAAERINSRTQMMR